MNGGYVLVVEDDPDCREALAFLLEECGYRAVAVADAESAVAVMRKLEPACAVLLDLNLPGASGRALAEILRGDVNWYAVPIFVVSGATDALPPGVAGVLQKPFDIDVLLAALARSAPLRAASQ